MMKSNLLDRPIAYHRIFVELTGSVQSAIMLSQAYYWALRTTDPDGWFYKSREDWTAETGLSRYEQETCRRVLRGTKFWEEKLKGQPATLHYRIHEIELFSSLQQTNQPKIQLAENPPTSRQQTNNHSTTEITTETTMTESNDSVPKDLFEDKASEKEEKDKERKRIFVACRDFWLTEVHKGWRFDGVEGKALKGILESGRKHFNKNHEREPSEEEMVNSFKHLCQKLSPYYSSKKLRHINQDFDIILDEMKTGNSKKLRGNSQVSIFSKYRQL